MKPHILRYILAACMLATCTLSSSAKDYQAVVFGAKSDGVTLNTQSIQRAIDHIAAEGGGRLIFTVGRYLTGAIQLKSNVTLHIGEGATLVAAPSIYNMLTGSMPPALISAKGQDHVAITGKGVIEGNSQKLQNSGKTQVDKGYLRAEDVPAHPMTHAKADAVTRLMPCIIYMEQCSNVTIKNIQIQDAANDAIVLHQSKGCKLESVRFFHLHGHLPLVQDQCTGVTSKDNYADDKSVAYTLVSGEGKNESVK